MAPRTIIVLDAAGIDDAVLAAAGLWPGQTVVAEATQAGLLLRGAEARDRRRVSADDARRLGDRHERGRGEILLAGRNT